MQWTAWIGLALGVVMASTPKPGPPPVILDLGPVVPTPAPTPKHAQRKRLITVITVQNKPEGESVISFEATDVADEGKDRVRTLASKTYSLAADEKPELEEMRQRILKQIRDLEREMLKYADKAGPPKERAPLPPEGRP
jgi:hypothetical protein